MTNQKKLIVVKVDCEGRNIKKEVEKNLNKMKEISDHLDYKIYVTHHEISCDWLDDKVLIVKTGSEDYPVADDEIKQIKSQIEDLFDEDDGVVVQVFNHNVDISTCEN